MRETETVPTQDDATAVARKAVPRPLSLSDYPESDGKPMAETPIHWHATVDAAQSLHDFYRDRADVYVGSDMMMYYREGDIRACVSPDVFVAIGVPKLPERRVWRTWVEGKLADFVLEITSLSTRREDEVTKRKALRGAGCSGVLAVRSGRRLPGADAARPPAGVGRRVPSAGPGATGWNPCHGTMLGLELRLQGDRLRFFDPRRGGYLLTPREKEEALRALQAENEDLRRRLRRGE